MWALRIAHVGPRRTAGANSAMSVDAGRFPCIDWRGWRTLRTVGTLTGTTGMRRIHRRRRSSRICSRVWGLEVARWWTAPPVGDGSLRRVLVRRALPVWSPIRMETIVLLEVGMIASGRIAVGQLRGMRRGRAAWERTVGWDLSRHVIITCTGAT